MWKEKESYLNMINKICNHSNYFSEQADFITERLDENERKVRNLYENLGGKELLELYKEIESNEKDIYTDLITSDLRIRYKGEELAKLLSLYDIEVPDVLKQYSFEDLDQLLARISIWEHYDYLKEQTYYKRDFIYLFTLFENELIDIIRLILLEASNEEIHKINDKISKIARSDLITKLRWFMQFKGGFKFDKDLLSLMICDRNAIVHNSSKYNKFLMSKLSSELIDANKISVNKEVEISKEKLDLYTSTLYEINHELIGLISVSFRTKQDRKDFRREEKLIINAIENGFFKNFS